MHDSVVGKSQSRLGFKSRFDQSGDSIWSLTIQYDINAIQFVTQFQNFVIQFEKQLNHSKLQSLLIYEVNGCCHC